MDFAKKSLLPGTISIVLVLGFFQASGAANIKPDEKEDAKIVNTENSTDSVTIYTEANFWGIPWALSLTNCTDVPSYFYKKTSSINTHENCVILFSRQQCQGRRVQIEPGTKGHSHLSDVDFDNTLASLKPCANEENGNASIISQRRSRREVPFFGELMKRFGISGDENNDENSNKDSQETGNSGMLNILQSLFGGSNTDDENEDKGSNEVDRE